MIADRKRAPLDKLMNKTVLLTLAMLFALIYYSIAAVAGFWVANLTGQFILVCLLSFGIFGFVFYFLLHYLLVSSMLKIDLYLLNALIKRRLIEIEFIIDTFETSRA